jgi:N-acetylglucosaminyldiphosphoundecaprenol N-acetyl-beta-D-mannosaminyltransferase
MEAVTVATKHNVLGVLVDAVDYDTAVGRIMDAARRGDSFAGSALAVHGVMEGVSDASVRARLNRLDLVTADGQPVRWALNLLHHTRLRERVYGPTLMLHVLAQAADEGIPVFFYGSRPEVLERLRREMTSRFPNLIVAGMEASKFRTVGPDERREIAARMRSSGARLAFIGLGCPRQEVFAHDLRDDLALPVLAVGAAFDYHAGLQKEPPAWIQRAGLQWLWRLVAEPRRLWRRYVLLNPVYVSLVAVQRLRLWRPDPVLDPPLTEMPISA